MKRKWVAFIMAVIMVFSMIPAQVSADTEDVVTITVVDENGTPIPDATVTVVRTYTSWRWTRTQTVTVTNNKNGTYTYDTGNYTTGTTQHYTISVERENYTMVTEQVDPATRSVVITLEPYEEPENWVIFDVYYIASGKPPTSFTGAGNAADYGPSGDNVALVQLNVNITALKSAEYAEYVVYEENNGNTYHFFPVGDTDGTTPEQRIEMMRPFWNAVMECTDEESKAALKATGLSESFVGYCLKNQGSAANPDNHLDGVLTVTPPVYVVELNDRGTYFGGFANDAATMPSITLQSVLDAYDAHYDQDVTWSVSGNGIYNGIYIDGKYKYILKLTQTNIDNATIASVADSDIAVYYEQITTEYYLATFDAELVSVEQVEFTVTYTDGVSDEVFLDQVTDCKTGKAIPLFKGDPDIRENYNFLGWTVQGGDGTILSQEDIANTYPVVTQDLIFVAAYTLKPATFAGNVEVILNGTYADGVATGERVDITTVKGNDISLAVSVDSNTYIPLTPTAIGVYTAKLENGSYHIYYTDGETYTSASDQWLDISDAARTRYLFFNSVTYDVNGGTGGPDPLVTYHANGTAVYVTPAVPEKEGYTFLGWQDSAGNLYQSGALLTTAIGEAYTLTATWQKITKATVDVTVIVNKGDDANTDRTLTIDLTYRPVDSNEDYVEVIGREAVSTAWYTEGTTANGVTTVVYENLFTELSTAYAYNANVFLSEYEVTERTVTNTTDADGNITYDVVVTLTHKPTQRMLTYTVVENIANEALEPTAVDLKVATWYDPSLFFTGVTAGKQWYPITQHVNTTVDVEFTSVSTDGNKSGTGAYAVWGWEDIEENRPYYYRVLAAGFTLSDGTELTAISTDGIHFTSVADASGRYPAGAYTAVVSIDGGNAPEGTSQEGAYFDESGVQNGTITVTVEAHPYTITFHPNGGTLLGSTEATVLADQFTVPDLNAYIPTRNDNYVFGGWYVADNEGTMTDATVTAGDVLTDDLNLIAQWKAPLTVEGLLTIGATYEQKNDDGNVTIQTIPEADRAAHAHVLLQRIDSNGYTETVQSYHIESIDYTNSKYYWDSRPVGVASYRFTDIPDDGTRYRIQVLLNNYESFFQNEPASVTDATDYSSYDATNYPVLWGDNNPSVGVVNIHNHFNPDEFTLTYTVDASAIGEDFRPTEAAVLITCDVEAGNPVPSTWPVISQMVFDDELRGNTVTLDADGIGTDSDSVWISMPDGTTYYQYGIRLQSTTYNHATTPFDANNPYYQVGYQDPAHYHYGAQSQLLKAVLTPRTYAVHYELGGGTLTGDYPTTHTWSHETALTIPTPTFHGFAFDGWYLDEAFTVAAGDAIAADVAADTTLYAKWVQMMDAVDLTVIINHTQAGESTGLAGNFNKTLYAQLTHDLRTNEGHAQRVFADVAGYRHSYPNGQWHTRDENITQDIFQVPRFYTNLSSKYDYSVNVTLDGYYVTQKTVEKIHQPDGSTLHKVTIELQYNPKLLTMAFYVSVDDSVAADKRPVSAEVKVTSWYDHPDTGMDWQWFPITQHEATTVTVTIDPEQGIGWGTYPVWQWYDEENAIPYHYRIEVLQLNFDDDSTVTMHESVADTTYLGGGYQADVEIENGAVPSIPGDGVHTTDLTGVYGTAGADGYTQTGTVGAVIRAKNSILFHTNNPESTDDPIFRAYYTRDVLLPADGNAYHVESDGTIPSFYDIPRFDYATHNNYIFKGWYMDPVSEEIPYDWSTTPVLGEHVYAHWITVGEVAKEDDGKTTGGDTYHEYDLIGVQIRDADENPLAHYGNPASGLRFITVLSERVYAQINAIAGNENGAEYGFVVAKSTTADNYAAGAAGYTLEYKAANVNGVNTTQTYKYVQNMRGDGVHDHYDGKNYRLYTAVITYEGVTGDAKEAAYATAFTARSYLRYYDANGLLRTYYNNYTGTPHYNGCRTSFAAVRGMM